MRRITLLVLVLSAAAVSWSGVLDRYAEPMAEAGFQRALVAFGVARTLNGVMSVAQGTELAIQPAGVGVTVTAGQILDPVNDLVERFSWLMLASSALLGLQMLLSGILSGSLVNAAISIALAVVILPRFWPRMPAVWGRFAAQVAVILLTLRFLFPVIALGEAVIYDTFLAERSAASLEYLERASERLGEAADLPEATDSNAPWWEQMAGLYRSAGKGFDLERRLEAYQTAVADASEHVIHLVVAFIMETMVIPLLALAGALLLIRGALRRSGRILFGATQ